MKSTEDPLFKNPLLVSIIGTIVFCIVAFAGIGLTGVHEENRGDNWKKHGEIIQKVRVSESRRNKTVPGYYQVCDRVSRYTDHCYFKPTGGAAKVTIVKPAATVLVLNACKNKDCIRTKAYVSSKAYSKAQVGSEYYAEDSEVALPREAYIEGWNSKKTPDEFDYEHPEVSAIVGELPDEQHKR